MTLLLYSAGIILLCYLIYLVSGLFESATEYLGRNMRNGVKGASLNAIASSMPELLTSFYFLFSMKDAAEGYSGTIGTTAGSAVFNALIIPSLVIFGVYQWRVLTTNQKIELNQKSISRDGLFLLISEGFLLITILTGEITWIDGLILMLLYVVYSWKLIKDSKAEEGDKPTAYIPKDPAKLRKSIINLTLSILGMMALCYFLVHSVEQIGDLLGINLLFTSVILAAAASSVPDLMISLRDAKSGNYDDAVANALGSNIFDICIAHGLPLFIYTLIYGSFSLTGGGDDQESNLLRIVLLVVTALSLFVYKSKGGVSKKSGYALFGLYLVFLGFVIFRMLAN